MSAGFVNGEREPIDSLKNDLSVTEGWLSKAISGLLSLWDYSRETALRNTDDEGNAFRPTATFQAITAIGECGIWDAACAFDSMRGGLRCSNLVVSAAQAPPTPLRFIETLLSFEAPTASPSNWLDVILAQSSHMRSGDQKNPSSRFTVVLECLVPAVLAAIKKVPPLSPRLEEALARGLSRCEERIGNLVSDKRGRLIESSSMYESAEFSPAILLNLVAVLYALDDCFSRFAGDYSRESLGHDREVLKGRIADAVLRNVEAHMARRSVVGDAHYDPVSLAFALRALTIVQPAIRYQPFFRACVAAIVEAQHNDGCWPDGASITYEATADVVQQPSVGVALLLAEAAVPEASLTNNLSDDRALLHLVLPALRRTAQHLRSTHDAFQWRGRDVAGWSSDRIRRKSYIETWITAFAARFYYRLWIAEKATLRHVALGRLGVHEFASAVNSDAKTLNDWRKQFAEPDAVTKPMATVWSEIVSPIVERHRMGETVQLPSSDGVSAIIFGPPGSGKTFFVKSVASFLGWPLVTLTPGHFISGGLELIEATAQTIFDYIHSLHHAVVFFDECDELFKQRDSAAGPRTILSFATASMLPKLQDLHDARNVIAFLGTNYLRNIDRAVRRPGRFDHVLLIDRPDDAARAEVLVSFGKASKKTVAKWVQATRGLTVKELFRAATQFLRDQTIPAETSVEDYREWCQEDGPAELQASRFDSAIRSAVLDRWKAIVTPSSGFGLSGRVAVDLKSTDG